VGPLSVRSSVSSHGPLIFNRNVVTGKPDSITGFVLGTEASFGELAKEPTGVVDKLDIAPQRKSLNHAYASRSQSAIVFDRTTMRVESGKQVSPHPGLQDIVPMSLVCESSASLHRILIVCRGFVARIILDNR
jgi:hypothetical protein